LIDDKATAFRAREREELQPTFAQLQRKNTNVTLRWFARGKLWESREAEQADFQQQRRAALEPRDRRDHPAGPERRGSDWRPIALLLSGCAAMLLGAEAEAESLLRDNFTTDRAAVSVTFNNGVTTPPVNTNHFTPSTGTTPAPGKSFVVGAICLTVFVLP